ncbi:hypothetical protein RF11_10481 [Thelohanellus kitauei]|uniref:Uncharacterized protein n=1 Tax=Thelohanellus kitauei TaxID=669202 RepID=A0A0C2MIQ7_THEKT|nr:hypothetical protein RF11_10481 [Thelohanellus kitauei]
MIAVTKATMTVTTIVAMIPQPPILAPPPAPPPPPPPAPPPPPPPEIHLILPSIQSPQSAPQQQPIQQPMQQPIQQPMQQPMQQFVQQPVQQPIQQAIPVVQPQTFAIPQYNPQPTQQFQAGFASPMGSQYSGGYPQMPAMASQPQMSMMGHMPFSYTNQQYQRPFSYGQPINEIPRYTSMPIVSPEVLQPQEFPYFSAPVKSNANWLGSYPWLMNGLIPYPKLSSFSQPAFAPQEIDFRPQSYDYENKYAYSSQQETRPIMPVMYSTPQSFYNTYPYKYKIVQQILEIGQPRLAVEFTTKCRGL